MERYIFDESSGVWYELQGDCYLPCLTVPEDGAAVGIWGQRHRRFLKKHKSAVYTGMMLSGKLRSYLADIDRQAEEMFTRTVKGLAVSEGVDEQLKDADQMAWVGAMNNIRQRATELVNTELIYR